MQKLEAASADPNYTSFTKPEMVKIACCVILCTMQNLEVASDDAN
jgi:hypothetical protein